MLCGSMISFFFFFQAEDGIRDYKVTGVQTCALPISWTGIGNVEGVLLRARGDPEHPDASISVRGGVVGYQLPPLRAEALLVFPGDTLIMATDGIRGGFATGLATESSPQEIAESILARFAKGTDDAHIVVARYLGAGL